jgi:HD superfamily phosphohydrolase
MLYVADDQLVVEAKGIYSIEKFLIARRLMYWQVYFHKTVIAAENLLVKVLQRARQVAVTDPSLPATPALAYFLHNRVTAENIETHREETLGAFTNLDDDDIMVSAKMWSGHSDRVLSLLSGNLIRRSLPRVRISDTPVPDNRIGDIHHVLMEKGHFTPEECTYLAWAGTISNKAYSIASEPIKIIYNNGEIRELAEVSDIFQVQNLNATKKKYFVCFPKEYGFNY